MYVSLYPGCVQSIRDKSFIALQNFEEAMNFAIIFQKQ